MCRRARHGMSISHGEIRVSFRNYIIGRWIGPKVNVLTTTPIGEKAGLKAIVETIDNRNDFKTFMQNFTVARGSQRGPSRNVPYDDGSVCDVFKWSGLLLTEHIKLQAASYATACPRITLWYLSTTTASIQSELSTISSSNDCLRIQQR
jgi:hypothetical protein